MPQAFLYTLHPWQFIRYNAYNGVQINTVRSRVFLNRMDIINKQKHITESVISRMGVHS